MGQSHMSKILSGLKRIMSSGSDVATTTTLSVLVFVDITFDAAAFDELAAFLQTRTTNGSGDIVHESHLRELHIEDTNGTPLPSRMSKRLAASILTAVDTDDDVGSGEVPSESRTVYLPTVGSQIHTLRLSNTHAIFCRHLGQNADRIRLKELQLFAVDEPDSRHLSKCLSRLPYLPKLNLRLVHGRTARRLILQGLKHNGSIGDCSVSFTSWEWPMSEQSLNPLVGYSSDDEDTEEYDKFNESESRLIAAYGYRNKVLGALLETGRYETTAVTAVAALHDDGRQASSNNDSCAAACTSAFDQADSISVSDIHYPLLMKTTMDVPRSCLGMVTRGLLKLDETIGQDDSSSSSGTKRNASECD
jgi:hypothetical protein